MSSLLKEKLITCLQRDRLSGFVKRAESLKDGCFFFSLLSVWSYYFANLVFDDSMMHFLDDREYLGVLPSDVYRVLLDAQPYFNLRLDSVIFSDTTDDTLSDFRSVMKLPISIPLVRGTVTCERYDTIYLMLGKSSTFFCSHYGALSHNLRLTKDELSLDNEHYIPTVAYRLMPVEPT